MGLTVVNREFVDEQGRVYNQYIGNVLDKRTVKLTVEINYNVVVSGSLSVTKTDNFLFLPIGTSWESLGIVEGCVISGNLNGTSIIGGTTVTNVDGNTMVLSVNQSGANQTYTTGLLQFDIVPESFELIPNFIPSAEDGSNFSLVDGEVNRFIADGIDALTIGGSSLPFSQLGNKSGGYEVFPTIKRIANLNGNRRYLIEIPNERNYLYLFADLFTGIDCVKPWWRLSAISQTANPSVRLSNTSTFTLGNTGFFNETFNQGLPYYYASGAIDGVYAIDYTTFTILGETATAFDHTQQTDFEVRVNGKFNATSKFGVAFTRQPNVDEFQNKLNWINHNTSLSINDNLSVGTPSDIIGFENDSLARVDIVDIEITQFSSYAIIKGILVPNSQYTTQISSSEDVSKIYRLAVKVEDWELTGDNIKPVWLSASYTDSIKFSPPLGEFSNVLTALFNHNNVEVPYLGKEDTPLTLMTEDDVKRRFLLSIPRPSQQEVTGRFFKNITLSVVAKKITGESFNLESYTLNLGSILTGDDTMIVNQIVPRGFKLPPTTDKNKIQISRYLALDNPIFFGVEVNYGLLLDWKYWQNQLNASIEFFPNQNKNWFGYQIPNWELFCNLEINTSDGSYSNLYSLVHSDYDTWHEQTVGTSVITYHLVDGTPITKPLANEITMVRATHTHPLNWNVPSTWGQITVEPYESTPRWMSSTVLPNGAVPQNPLPPLAGETKCKLTVTGNVAVLETLFDPTKIDITKGISFTSRIEDGYRSGDTYVYKLNRTKDYTVPIQSPKQFENDDRSDFECCEKRKVIGDLNNPETKRNDVTSHVVAGESVEFILYNPSGNTGYVIDSLAFSEQSNMWYCQLNWRDILSNFGAGCYRISAIIDFAGLQTEIVLENYQLLHYSYESTANDVRLTVIYNANDLKNNIIYNNTNVIDSIRVNGQFNYSQPNLNIQNYTKTSFEQNKITRQARETLELRTGQLSEKAIRMLKYVLQHENYLLITDYCLLNPRYDLIDKAVILTETPILNYVDTGSRTISATAKFEEKIISNISTFSNDNVQQLPISITFTNGSGGGGFSTIVNSDGSFNVTFDSGTTYELEDYTLNVLRNGVLISTTTFPALEPVTDINITI